MKKIVSFVICFLSSVLLIAQEHVPVNGVRDDRPERYAFTGAKIYVTAEKIIENGTLLIENGKVKAVGTSLSLPSGTVQIALDGKSIYPGFIDAFSHYGQEKVKKQAYNWMGAPQLDRKKENTLNWNDAIKASFSSFEGFSIDTKRGETYKKAGFTAVHSFRPDGIARGFGTLVALVDENPNEAILIPEVSSNYSFDKGSSTQDYPTSLMGAVALLRQTLYDTEWYNKGGKKDFRDATLEAMVRGQNLPRFIEVDDRQTLLTADKVGDEFGFQFIIKATGEEYQRIEDIASTRAPLIVPVKFPDAYDVDNPYEAIDLSLTQLKHWEMAPSNPGILEKAGLTFALSMEGHDKESEFFAHLRKAIEAGLSKKQALKSLTEVPAQLLKAADQLGSLEAGKWANFFISDGDIFEESTTVYQTWVKGKVNSFSDLDEKNLAGSYDLQLEGREESLLLKISGKPGKHKAKIHFNDSTHKDAGFSFKNDLLNLSFPADPESSDKIRLSGWISDEAFKGRGQNAEGQWLNWSASKKEAEEEKEDENGNKESDPYQVEGSLIYPFLAYGRSEIPKAERILFKNATVWTNESEGVLEESDVLVENGKIARIGKDLSLPGAKEIDARGKHLTSGIIDEHSHIALKSINEGAQSNTVEVRMEDVVNAEDINIYRQLAGGVTASQLLHGSANSIGGQSAIVKLRWGHNAQNMLIEGATPFVKFALGENVKQSNRPRTQNIRYPQTRMGVEQVFVDAFTRAQEYEAEWKAYESLSQKQKSQKTPPRRDLELDGMVEILNEKRLISCHSYVQSEINMLIKVAERFGFTINTFTHILEGYKVADKMKDHGVGGSTFADWWAYKYEVKEAIPYNAHIMHSVGIVTAINSDDAEMARRLNQEAAKSVKYGGMSEEDAWKMVTLNPAKLLRLDDRMGSIKAGKDADLVLWNENPLSIYASPDFTLVDGRIYFDKEEDQKLREELEKERIRLIQKMKQSKEKGSPTQKVKKQEQHMWHCDHISHYKGSAQIDVDHFDVNHHNHD